MLIGFLLSTSAMIVIIVFLMTKDKAAMRPLLFVGIGLALVSLILRNLLRFKPDWFKDKSTGEESEKKVFEEESGFCKIYK